MQIEFRQIERIEIKPYDGQVHNLTTDTEEYIAEGVVVHNCPHVWSTRPDKVAKEDCKILWMGE